MFALFLTKKVVAAWPCETITVVIELYRCESKKQIYGAIHNFRNENSSNTKNLGQNQKASFNKNVNSCCFS